MFAYFIVALVFLGAVTIFDVWGMIFGDDDTAVVCFVHMIPNVLAILGLAFGLYLV